MRKLLVIGVLALIAAAAFAQDAPKNNEIYGTVWLDYDASGARFDNTAPFSTTASDFSFSRIRFGLRNTLADGVKSWFEFDPRNLEFRQVNVDWSPIANLDLIAGKQSKLFAQNNDWIFGDRTLGIQARYALPGARLGGRHRGQQCRRHEPLKQEVRMGRNQPHRNHRRNQERRRSQPRCRDDLPPDHCEAQPRKRLRS